MDDHTRAVLRDLAQAVEELAEATRVISSAVSLYPFLAPHPLEHLDTVRALIGAVRDRLADQSE